MNVLPQPYRSRRAAGAFPLTARTRIEYADLFSPETYRQACLLARRIEERHGFTLPVRRSEGHAEGTVLLGMTDDRVIADAIKAFGLKGAHEARRREGYVLAVAPDRAFIAGHDGDGLARGVQTFLQLIERERATARVPCGEIVDRPAHDFRGVHMYVPPKAEIPHFLRLIEFFAACKLNAIVLEIAAGIELKRHPEINRAWERYGHMARKFPFTQGDLQGYRTLHGRGKDSNHFEQGGGTCISQDEMRRILRCARENHVEIIPEIQSPSHAYWLCLAHPEIAEWQEDAYPDTICPSNPKSYELLFDAMDEIIELMEPQWVHSGNDEYYFYAICPRCRVRDSHDILSGHLNKVNAFLRARGVKHMMWADKLINPDECEKKRMPEFGTGRPIRWGGGERLLQDSTGRYVQRATWKAVDRIPDDVLMMDWYYSLSPDTDRYFAKHGKEVVFGNFGPFAMARTPGRLYAPNVRGAEISTWIENGELSLAHNNFPLQAAMTGDVLWSEVYRKADPRKRMSFFLDHWRRTRDLLHAPEDKLISRKPERVRYRMLTLSPPASAIVGTGPLARAIPAVRVEKGGYPVPFRIAKMPIVVRPGDMTGYTVKVASRVRAIAFLHGITVKAADAKRMPLYDYSDYKEYFLSREVGALQLHASWAAKDARRPDSAGRVPIRLGLETGSLIEPALSSPSFCDAILQSDGTAVFVWEWVNPNPEHIIIEDITLTRGRSDIPGDLVVYAITLAL